MSSETPPFISLSGWRALWIWLAIIILCLRLPQFVVFPGCILYQDIMATLLDDCPTVEDEDVVTWAHPG